MDRKEKVFEVKNISHLKENLMFLSKSKENVKSFRKDLSSWTGLVFLDSYLTGPGLLDSHWTSIGFGLFVKSCTFRVQTLPLNGSFEKFAP